MLTKQRSTRSSRLGLLIGLAGVGVGVATGFFVGINPLYLVLPLGAIPFLFYFFSNFEQAVIGLLILRSALDPFSDQQLPALFAIGLDALTLLYVIVMLLTRRTVHTDGFWWFLTSWVAFQGLWLILMALGGLGLDASYLSSSIREWVRLFSWLMVYLLVMQLKDRFSPDKMISWLFLALVIPLTVGLTQIGTHRINGTLGHSNTFATFLLLFLGLTWWKLGHSRPRLPWVLLLGVVAFFYVGTKALFSLIMLAVFVLVLIAPRLNLVNLIGGILLIALVIGLFMSTEFGQERLASIANTPLLNPNIDISRAILLSYGDQNSFNWRLSHWNLLIKAWQQFPIFGYGLASAQPIGNGFLAHSDYVRALVEGGIVGLVAFLAFIVAQFVRLVLLIRSAPRGSRQRSLCLTLLAILLSISVGMITENIWSHTTLFFYWWSLFGIAGWKWNELELSQSPTSTKTRWQPLS
ncbi:O-antigen ligase family protein [Scytonema sp. PCC 10023]|uniref:O-antigen ligase family protein n=1 Tax=Scytonema sp. PCC 10023 TaxID=1680591 RepID=UPI0039C72389